MLGILISQPKLFNSSQIRIKSPSLCSNIYLNNFILIILSICSKWWTTIILWAFLRNVFNFVYFKGWWWLLYSIYFCHEWSWLLLKLIISCLWLKWIIVVTLLNRNALGHWRISLILERLKLFLWYCFREHHLFLRHLFT